jgi:hypothetical protein
MIVAVVSIFIALYNFDIYDFNRSLVSTLVILSAILVVSPYPKLNEVVRNAAVFLTIFLIMKLLITG